MKRATDTRWKAVVTYRSEHGDLDIEHYFEEIIDLNQLIEAGPHFDTLLHCVITVNRTCEETELTVERAATL